MGLPTAFFRPRDGAFEATTLTRGPWDAGLQHAGPACALVARAIEARAPELHVARLTFDLVRALPISGRFEVDVQPTRAGRKVSGMQATVTADGREMVRASALLLRREDIPVPPIPDAPSLPSPDAGERWEFPFFREEIGYHRSMELRRVAGTFGQGHMSIWFRMTCALVEGEEPTALQRLVAAADSGNGVSVGLDLARYTFVNPDLSIVLARPPVGEWFALDARSFAAHSGSGFADTQLHDLRGVLGRAVQTLLVERRQPSAG